MIRAGTIIEERFKVTELIDQGGMGNVWKAIDLTSPPHSPIREVVVKELKNEHINDSKTLVRFASEIEILKKLTHPNIVKYIATGVDKDKKPYLVMEFINGQSLRHSIKQQGIKDFREIASIIEQIGKAIQAAHDHKIYHRDLKPENIMVSYQDGEPIIKVIDFGVATIKMSIDETTKTTSIIGTVDYMAPEQICGKPSASSDIYAMGVISYEMISGIRPYNLNGVGSAAAILYEQQKQAPGNINSLHKLRLNVPKKANDLIISSLSLHVKDRPASAIKFAHALAKALRSWNDSTAINNITANLSANLWPLININSRYAFIRHQITPVILIGYLAILFIIVFIGQKTFQYLTLQPIVTAKIDNKLLQKIDPLPILVKYWISLNEPVASNKYRSTDRLAGEQIVFHKDDLVRFNFLPQQSCYLYIIDQFPQEKSNHNNYKILFPLPDENHFLKQALPYVVPSQADDKGFHLTGQKGIEKIWLIFTSEKDPLLEELVLTSYAKYNKDEGIIKDLDKIEQLDRLMPKGSSIHPEFDNEHGQIIIRDTLKTRTVTLLKLLRR